MAFSTFLKAQPNVTLSDQREIILAYVIAFGAIPSIKETTHGIMLSDAGHLLVTTYENEQFKIDVSLPPEDCMWVFDALVRLCKILGGGEVSCSTEYETIAPLTQTTKVDALANHKVIFEQSFDDFEKFLERPYDDKGFLKEKNWTEDLSFKFHKILLAIDEWYFENINLPNIIKYFVSKQNMENFCLYALKDGAEDLNDIVENINDYNENYLTYLARYDKDVFAAMKKGLKCLIQVNQKAKAA